MNYVYHLRNAYHKLHTLDNIVLFVFECYKYFLLNKTVYLL